MKTVLNGKLMLLLLKGDTTLLRLFFALSSFGFSMWVLFDKCFSFDHPYVAALMKGNIHLLAVLFGVHSFSVLYGVLTSRYSNWLLFTEAILGAGLWVVIGLAEAFQQHAPGPMLLGGAPLSMFLLIRYPTHNESSR